MTPTDKALKQLRGLGRSYELLLWTLYVDWEAWSNAPAECEQYPGEGKERAEAFDLLLKLLTGSPAKELPGRAAHAKREPAP